MEAFTLLVIILEIMLCLVVHMDTALLVRVASYVFTQEYGRTVHHLARKAIVVMTRNMSMMAQAFIMTIIIMMMIKMTINY